ncbi:MAG: DUF4292 domain-containing protein [Flavobacteriaceae bacterium]|nr:DUF4292 domain-containing protein [Flavobacteriaceae bacterium]
MNKIIQYSFVILLFLSSCKTQQVASGSSDIKKMSAKEVIKKHDKSKADFKTLSSKLKVRYEDPTQTQNVTVSLRIEKDKKIWISASLLIPLAKVLITPERISYYNKIDKTYFEGDFSLVSNWLGTELDFQQVQSLLLGESLFDLNDGKHTAEVYDTSYLVKPKKQLELFERLFLINAKHFKMDSQEISQVQESRILLVNYNEYQDVSKEKLPKKVKVVAVDKKDETKLDIDFRSITLNRDLSFPFKIPGHYSEIKF